MLETLINYAFQGFWQFVGVYLLILIPFRFGIQLFKATSEWSNTRKHGWDPYRNLKNEDELTD